MGVVDDDDDDDHYYHHYPRKSHPCIKHPSETMVFSWGVIHHLWQHL